MFGNVPGAFPNVVAVGNYCNRALPDDYYYSEELGKTVTVYSLSGTVLQNTTVQQGRISLSDRKKGVYAIQLGTLGSTLIRR